MASPSPLLAVPNVTAHPSTASVPTSSYSIGTLVVDEWAVTFGTVRRGLGGLWPRPSPLLAVPNVTAHPSTASVTTSSYSM